MREEQPVDFDPFAGPAIAATGPSSEAQREIWTATLMGREASLAYNESITLVLQGEVDLDLLRATFQDLVARHEALRTTFSADGLTLCVSAELPAPPAPRDLSTLDAAVRSAELQRVLADEAGSAFDLEHGPLHRVHILRFGPREARVVFTAHHIVVDGWSTAVLLKDWAALYSARSQGKAPALPAAPTYTSYARHLLDTAQAPERAADERYWLERFAGELPVLDLPSDRPRPPHKTFSAKRVDTQLDATLLAALKKTGAKQRASLFTTLLAAFESLVFRLSGQEDLVIGVPAAGQSSEGYEQLVGHCVNMLPLRSQLTSELGFSELLASLRTTMLDAFEHQQYTFGTLLSKLPIARDPSRLPLVSVVFNLDRGLTSDAIGFAGITATCLTNPRQAENFDLFLNVVELPTGLGLECQYNTDLFDRESIERWLAAYEQVLRAIVDDPTQAIGRLPVVSAQELSLYERWNAQSQAPRVPGCLVHDLIEASAARTPEAVACVFEGSSITYAELNARANQLARRLRSVGAARGALIGLSVERSINMLVGLVGVLKAGAAYVPLDPGYPLDRLAYMAEDARMNVLVTERSTRAQLPLSAAHVICLDDDAELEREPRDNLSPDARSATADSPAYVIYTSGSTGKPKGVVLAHRSAVNLLESVARTPGMQASDVVLAVTTLAFDIALSELILPLTVGAKIALVSREVASDGARLLEVVQRSGVTFIDATPATYRLLLGAGFAGDSKLTAICTGEALPRDLASSLIDKVGALWNGYGPTETTVWSTFYRVQKPIQRVLIGRPVDNTQIHILDGLLQPTPLGVPGEIYIAGEGVAIGYLNRPELSAERFVPDRADPHKRMYRTGDLGRYLPSGEIECLGRNDNQVKLRGYRIELGEIENALGQHAAVRQTAVIVREDRPGDARLVGYVVTEPGASVQDAELRAHLKQTLPDYMVPATYVHLSQMPLTPSGKINRRALPAPAVGQGASQSDFVPASSASELLLAGLWQDALNVPRISVHDDFFALGGHSLLASQVLSRLRRDHGIQLSFRKIFEAPTIAELARVLDAQTEASDASATSQAAKLEHRADLGPSQLSISQERLWLLEQMDPTQELVHNLPAAWRLEGPVDIDMLQRALDVVVRRHDTLRTTFKQVEGKVVQDVAPEARLPIVLVDLSDRPESERTPAMRALIDTYTRERFDLARGPLFRSYLFRFSAQEHVYFSVRHNIVWDGWSFDVFLRELTTLYSAYEAGTEPVLPELPVTWSDYVRWHDRFLEGPEIARQISWWRERLSGALPDLALPSDRPRPATSQHHGDNASITLTREDAEALTALGRKSGATLFMVLFAAYNVMLHRYSGQRTVLVGTPVRARNRPEVENLIGPFVNTVVLRTDVEPELSFPDLLAQVRDVTLDAFSHEDMPLERLGARPPIVRAFFSFQDARTRPPALGKAQISQIHVEPKAAANDLMMWTMETRGELLAVVNYSTELFDPQTIARFLEGFRSLLRGVLHAPQTRIGALPIAAPSEADELRRLGTPSGAVAPALCAQVEHWAAHAPSTAAVSDGERSLSYAQLWQRASALASRLHGRARCGVLATSSLERCVALVAADLAGCSVAMLDPSYPAARTRALCAALSLEAMLVADASARPAGVAESLPLIATSDSDASPETGRADAPQDAPLVWITRVDARSQVQALPVSRAALATGALGLARVLHVAAGNSVLSLSGPAAELYAAELALPLMVGATLVQPASQARIDRLPGYAKLDLALGPASALGRLSPAERAAFTACAVTGEATQPLAAALLGHGKTVYRVDALPENNLAPFAQQLTAAHEATRAGKPVFPTRAAVLGPDGQLSPIGVPGQLAVASELAPQGGQPAAALRGWPGALAFVTTARRARFMRDGSLELIPDFTREVDVGGVRVCLDEIAHLLAQHPSVSAARVLASHTKAGVPRLDAYVSLRPAAQLTETELRRHLQQSLPASLVPPSYIEVDDPAELADPSRLALTRSSSGADAEYVTPRNASERLIAEHWCRALQLAKVSVHDNFFALGGHSLLCFEVIGAIEKSCGRRLSPRILLLGTLEQVAVELDRAAATPPVAAAPQPAPAQDAKPESALASRLLRKLKGLVR